MSNFYLGQKFCSFAEFEQYLKEYENSNYVKFYKRDSTKINSHRHKVKHFMSPDIVYYDVKYTCIRGGPLKVKGTGKRKSSTFKMDCPAHISLRSTLCGKYLEIRKLNEAHNHEISKLLFDHLPQQRKLPEAVREKTKKLLSLNVDKRVLQQKLLKETGKIVTIRDLSNLSKGIKKRTTELCDAVSSLLQVEYGTDEDLSDLLKKKDKSNKPPIIKGLSSSDLGKSTIIHLQPYVENEVECDTKEDETNDIKMDDLPPPPALPSPPPPAQSPPPVTYLLASDIVMPESTSSAEVCQSESNVITIQDCSNCSHLEARLDAMEKKLETIQHMLENNTTLLQKTAVRSMEYSASVQLQAAQTYEQLTDLNESLTNEEEFVLLESRLGLQGGKDIVEVTKRILSIIISNHLAVKLNWRGGNGKYSIQDFPNIIQLVKASVRRNKGLEEVSDVEVEDQIKHWLRYACNRLSGFMNSRKSSFEINGFHISDSSEVIIY